MSFLSALAEALGKYERDGDEWKPEGRIFLLGNGGSATVAEHIANDLIKLDCDAATPNYASLTCLANDYSWERAFACLIPDPCDQLILISSSGKSKNLLHAAQTVLGEMEVITLTGFDPDNPLRKLGHTNYYVPSHNYGIVECAHLAILHSIVNPGEL